MPDNEARLVTEVVGVPVYRQEVEYLWLENIFHSTYGVLPEVLRRSLYKSFAFSGSGLAVYD